MEIGRKDERERRERKMRVKDESEGSVLRNTPWGFR